MVSTGKEGGEFAPGTATRDDLLGPDAESLSILVLVLGIGMPCGAFSG